MGNEMGNTNVSSLQERENNEFEAANKSSELPIGTSNDNNTKAESQPVSSPKEEAFHEKQKDMISEDSAGTNDPHTEKAVSAKRGDSEEQALDRSSRGSLMSNDRNNMNEQLSSSEDGLVDEISSASVENSAETSENRIQDQSEPETAEVQAPDGSTKPQFLSNDSKKEVTQSVISSADESFAETDSAPNKNLLKHSSGEIQKQMPIRTGLETADFQARNGSTESQLVSNDTNDEGRQSVLSSVDGRFCEADSVSDKNLLKSCDGQIQKQMPMGTALETAELEALNVPKETQLASNNTNNEGTQSVLLSEDGTFPEADSASDRSLLKPSDGQIQQQMPVETELEAAEFHAPDGSTKTQLVSINTNDGGIQSVLSSEDGTFHKADSASDNLLKPLDGRIPEQMSIKSEPERTEVQAPDRSKDTNDEGTQSLSSEDGSFIETDSTSNKNLFDPSNGHIQEKMPIETDYDKASTLLMLKDSKDEEIQPLQFPEEGCFDENACNERTSETSDHQVHKQTITGKEGAELVNSSPETILTLLNSESPVAVNLSSHQLKPDNINAEPYVENGRIQERNESDTLGLRGACDAKDRKELENGTKHTPDGSAFPTDNSVVDMHGDGKQMEDIEAQEDTLLDSSKISEKNLETKVGVDDGETLKSVSDVQNGEIEHQFLKLKLNRKNSTDSQLEYDPVTRSLESFQVRNLQSDDKFVVLTDDTNLFEIETGTEQMKQSLNLVPTSEEPAEEPKVDKRKIYNSEYKMIGVDNGDDNKEMEAREVNKYTIKTDPQTSEEKLVVDDNGQHLAFNDSETSLACRKDNDLENETELLSEVSAFPTDSTMMDSNSVEMNLPACSLSSFVEEAVTQKGELQDCLAKDAHETEVEKPVSFALGLTEPDTIYPVTTVETRSQHATQNLTAMATEMLENRRSLNFELKQDSYREVDGKTSNFPAAISTEVTPLALEALVISRDKSQRQDQVCNPSDSTCVNNSDMNCRSPDSNESYKTAYEQENLSPKVDVRISKFSFDLGNQIAEIVVTETLPEPMNTKDGSTILATSDFQAKSGVGRLASQPCSADLNLQAEVSRYERAELLKETPLQYEEKTVSSEIFRPNCYSSEVYAGKVGISIGSPGAETELSALLQEDKENSVEKPEQKKISEEKQVSTLGRNSSERSNIPLLSFLKEESDFVASQRQQENLGAKKKATENRWNSHDKKTKGIPPQGGVKRKAKPLFFNICICCTTEIP